MIDRVDAILNKLSDRNISVRLRALKSLNFKLSNNLIDAVHLKQSFFYANIVKSISSLFDYIINSESVNLSDDEDFEVISFLSATEILSRMIRIIQSTEISDDFQHIHSSVTSQLYQISSKKLMSVKSRKILDDAIKLLVSSSLRENSKENVSNVSDLVSSGSRLLDDSSYKAIDSNLVLSNGAGAILRSSLVYIGWKFPSIFLSDADEKYLFELEVKLKLKHEDAGKLLLNCLADFPGPVLLQRVDLMHTLLEAVGSVFSHADFEADPFGLHALAALKALKDIFLKCQIAYEQICDGGLCCNHNVSNNEESNYEHSIDSQKNVFSLRYPSAGSESADDHVLVGKGSLLPIPSFSGFAFACCAASLPLLNSRDAMISIHVRSLFSCCIKMISEPHKTQHISDTFCHDSVVLKRWQHLLNRFDQLSQDLNISPNFSPFWNIVKVDHNFSSQNKKENESILASIKYHCANYDVLALVGSLFEHVPISLIQLRDNNSQKTKPCLIVGGSLMNVAIKMLTCSEGLSKVIEPYYESLHQIVSKLSPELIEHMNRAKGIARCSKFFVPMNNYLSTKHSISLVNIISNAKETIELLFPNAPIIVEGFELAHALPILLQYATVLQQTKSETDTTDSIITIDNLMNQLLYFGRSAEIHKMLEVISNADAITMDHDPNSFLAAKYFLRYFPVDRLDKSFALKPFCNVLSVKILCKYCLSSADGNDTFHVILDSVVSIILTTKEWEIWLSTLPWIRAVVLKVRELKGVFKYLDIYLAELDKFAIQKLMLRNDASLDLVQSLLIGMFSPIATNRVDSSSKLFTYCLGKKSAFFKDDATSTSEISWVDPFHSGSFLTLNDYISSSSSWSSDGEYADAKRRNQKNSAFTHSDLEKLRTLGCGDFDISIKASAMEQLHLMLSSDEQLLSTCPIDWILSLCRNILNVVDSAIFGCGLVIEEDRIRLINKLECSYGLICMKLLITVVKQHPNLLDRAKFTGASENVDTVSFLVVLKIALLAPNFIAKFSLLCEGSKFIKQIAEKSFYLLHFICTNYTFWRIQDPNHVDVICNITEVSQFSDLKIPSFLVDVTKFPSFEMSHFHLLEPSNNSRIGNMTNGSVGKRSCNIIEINIEPLSKREFPPLDLIESAMEDESTPTLSNVQVAVATTMFDLLVNAKGHQDFFESTLVTRSCCHRMLGLDESFVSLNINLITAVSNIVTNLPRTSKDKFTLFHTLWFICEHLKELSVNLKESQTNSSQNALSRRKDILETVVTIMEAFVPVITSLFLVDSEDKKLTKRESNFSFAIKLGFLDFIQIITSFPIDSLSIGSLLYESRALQHIVLNYMNNEAAGTIERSRSFRIVENLINFHDGFSLLRVIENFDSARCEVESDPIYRLIRTSKFLRGPDSFQQNCVSVGSLRVLYHYLRAGGKDYLLHQEPGQRQSDIWLWITRLLFDRRSEIRLLSLEIIDLLLPLEHQNNYNDDNCQSEHLEWPPLQQIYHIAIDGSECANCRAKSLKILIRSIMEFATPINFSVARIIDSLNSLISADDCDSISILSLSELVDTVTRILCTNNSVAFEDFFPLLRSRKIFPKLVSFLNSASLFDMLIMAQKRRFGIRKLESSFFRGSETTSPEFVSKQYVCAHYDNLSSSVIVIHSKVASLLLKLSSFDSELFCDCVKYSDCIQHIFSSCSSLLQSACCLFEKKLPLIALKTFTELIIHSSLWNNSPNKTRRIASNIFTEASLSILMDTISAAITSINLCDMSAPHNIELGSIGSACRLLCHVLSDDQCLLLLGCNLATATEQTNDVAKGLKLTFCNLFKEIINFSEHIRAVVAENIHLKDSLGVAKVTLQLNVTVAMFIEKCYICRMIFRNILLATFSATERGGKVSFLLDHYLNILEDASKELTAPLTAVDESKDSLAFSKKSSVHSSSPTLPFGDPRIPGTADISTSISSSVASATNKWRGKVRSYSVTGSGTTKKKTVSGFNLSNRTKAALWSTCLVLKVSFASISNDLPFKDRDLFFSSICKLLHYFSRYSFSSLAADDNYHDSFLTLRKRSSLNTVYNNENGSLVNDGQAAASVIACITTIISENSALKHLLVQSFENPGKILTLDNSTTSLHSSILHFLTSVSFKDGKWPASRWLTMHLIGALINGQIPGKQFSPSAKVSISNSLAAQLQQKLHKMSSSSLCEATAEMYHFLSTLSSFIIGNYLDAPSHVQLSRNQNIAKIRKLRSSIGGNSDQKGPSLSRKGEVEETLPLGELLLWITDRFCHVDFMLSAVARIIGRLVIASPQNSLAIVLHDNILQWLLQSCIVIENETTSSLVSACLWSLISQSEKAKAHLKKMSAIDALTTQFMISRGTDEISFKKRSMRAIEQLLYT